uniref:UHRF1-binding protein 1 n=1 Tax=Knipowitschia caucasica TaxID=637954 RepID=A0AAV2LZR6_KNICA
MAGIIKKQILKHLSRFTKNLSPDKINLSTLKGEGQLSNLELDEEVLQNMLDLPTWLAVTRVYCNKAAIRVEKVVEGMSIRINTITIKVQARAFHASFELWQLQGSSLNPKWQRSDLRYTRISDSKKGEVLTFKEINWQSLRIEADAIERDDQDLGSTPLRLITNQGRIRIALKRRIKDCNVLASKLFFILDDLLWVLTDSQLKAIIHYAKSLSEAMEKSAKQRKNMTAESMQASAASPGMHSIWTEPTPASTGSPNSMSQYFDLYDVKESSYHTFISRLDLHICNDSSSSDDDEPPPPASQGSLQLTFKKLGFDFYPIHRPADGCKHWERHNAAMEAQAQWTGKLLQDFQRRAEASGFPGPLSEANPPTKDSPDRTRQESTLKTSASEHISSSVRSELKRLRSSSVVIRMDDFDIHQVSTRGRQNKRTQSFLSCNRKSLHLPDNIPAIHLQFTEYYFPDNSSLEGPTSSLYAQLNGIQLSVDPASVLWINLFSRGLLHTLDQVKAFYHLQDSSKTEEHIDLRMDAAQLKIVFPLDSSILDHPERPQSLSIAIPQLAISNTRHCPHGTGADLSSIYNNFTANNFFKSPSDSKDQTSFHPLPPAFLRHSQETETQPVDQKQRSQDVWSLSLSRITLGFDGARRSPKGRTQPFVEPLTMSVWMCRPRNFSCESEDGSFASFHFLVHAITPVKIWLNHYQYVALLRMKDAMARLGAELGRDTKEVIKVKKKKPEALTACFSLLLDSAELGLLLPPVSSEPEPEVAHTPETDSPSISESDLYPSHHVPDLVPEENGISSVSTGEAGLEQDAAVEEACEAVEEQEEGTDAHSPAQSPVLSPGQSPALSREPSSFSLEGELSSAITVTKDVTKDALTASLDLTKGAFSMTKDAFSMLSRGSGMSKLFSPAKDSGQASEQSSPVPSLRSMKQSPSQHSFDSAILDGSLPDENLSVDSDLSEGFVVLMGSESGVESMRPNHTGMNPGSRGSPAPGTDGGSSADLSSSLSQSTEDVSQDMASAFMLLLSGIACTMEAKGDHQMVVAEAQNLVPVHLGNIRSTDIQAGLVQVPDGVLQKQNKFRKVPAVRLRTEMGASAAENPADYGSVMSMSLQDCSVELLSSTLANIGPFLEDEFAVDSPPMKLHMNNITVTIKDDGPRIYPTAPQPVPATFIVDQLMLERGDDGILRINAESAEPKPKSASNVPLDQDRESQQDQTRTSGDQLSDVQAALSQALSERDRLLLEVRKHDPTFSL